ncbi:UDP-N-acetylglucosamine 2-epimerase [Acetivibrio saccincola]|jgi:UDP-N-acetylglucosamine 2-epimerase (non-hydrolysing)/GDP/UDP-N,N'-diacetylbacillosamine 2-epimerase (hydrolysing)|uniref:GDP/UDP-N,N'-diacetylbacillosamine 2-epimerase (Hydrolyzing) n=1 Tax=Acetivibrio saccincola TaxID=1677857 RepID=A0A2K9E8J5_9FIRM|nr:UDP-N-acetylglucosamine 2-epimerase [Acetivibrio saccincola]AUG57896.1 GDP/UDP-N,N'-diacetylbacillosamine 2-epimerase (hydrolyzing) [Acetivibrio saccincola]NLW27517.1 UDP-N-acetylglucosamine 2-epimerase (hydrolyzing) [Acetivibrio saccincola]PQQ67793.1 UDP-N-acetylglucosamine 2-epimerase (hydrolyzing) [Acetivibrio saccincola]
MSKSKICVVTGTRAEYGLLYPVIKAISEDEDLHLQLIATGMHLSHEFGLTFREIEKDGFYIDKKIEMLLSSDTPVGTVKAMGLGLIGFADAYSELKPDLLVVLGDRFEILAACQAALIFKIPIAHIGGGDTTEGAFDESIRHSITKMSHLHFVTNEKAYMRVVQMGEKKENVYNVGSPGIDVILNTKLLAKEALEKELNLKFHEKNLLITYHPETLSGVPSCQNVKELLYALDGLGENTGLIFTKSNADPEGREIINLVEEFVKEHPNAYIYHSLGRKVYLSVMTHVDAVVGNSSSGLYEAPSFKKPTVNIGDRQKGRLMASSVINCAPERGEILKAIKKAFVMDCSDTVNPYGDGKSSKRIVKVIKSIKEYKALLKKRFYDF